MAQAEEVSLRDLRALVAGSDAVGRDEGGRELAGRLRQVLDERSTKERDLWLAEITEALEAGRIVRALRASGRPPEPGVRFPQPLAERLTEAANGAMAADVAPDRWAAVLDAVTASPVRRLVKPQALPTDAPPELVQTARQAADRVPGLVPLVGAPEPSARPAKKAAGPRAGRGPGGPGPARPGSPPRRPPLPPPPPRPARPSAEGEKAPQGEGAPVSPPTEPSTEPTEPTEVAEVADAASPGPAPEPVPERPAEQPAGEPPSGDHGDDAVLVEELG
jgi:hypothetical protein